MTTSYPQLVRSVAGLGVAIGLAYGLYVLLQPFLVPLIIAGVITLLARPLYLRLRSLLHFDALAAILTLLLSALLVLVPLALITGLLIREIAILRFSFQEPVQALGGLDHLVAAAAVRLSVNSFHPHLQSYLLQALSYLEKQSLAVIGGVLGVMATFFLTVIFTFYLLQGHDGLKGVIIQFSPLSREDTTHILDRTREVIRAAVQGNLVLITLQALCSMLGFYLLGISTPVLLGLLYGISSLIPTVGASLVWIPVAAFLLVQGNLIAGIGIIAWALTQIAILDSFVGPRLIQRHTHLHPFLILLGILGGVARFGVIGIVVGPTMVALGLVGLEILRRSWQERPTIR